MSVKSGEFQKVGEESPLSHKPVSSPSADPRGGQFQIMGDRMPLNHTPVASPSANPKSGEFQIVGDKQPMNRTAVHGWGDAAPMPMSERVIDSDKAAGMPGGPKR